MPGSAVIFPPQSMAVDYSLREEPQRPRARPPAVSIDLSEWRDHRVLALRDSRYYPGVIRKANNDEIFVAFDGEGNKLVRYSDVLVAGKYKVIGDASPSLEQVCLDAEVCIRCPFQNSQNDATASSLFVKGTVCKILMKPSRFVVKMQSRDDEQGDSFVVKRSDLRLIRPLWWEELKDMEDSEFSPRVDGAVGESCLFTF